MTDDEKVEALSEELETAQRQARRLEDESNEARRLCIVAERERDEARAEVERLRAEGERWMQKFAETDRLVLGIVQERGRLVAVLAETPENVRHYQDVAVLHHDEVLRMLRAIAARAGMEPTPGPRCEARNAQGAGCGLPVGHAGDHQVEGILSTAGWPREPTP